MLNLKSAGARGPFGDPGTAEVQDASAALKALATSGAGASRTLFLRQGLGAGGHIQGLTHLSSGRGERILALCASARAQGTLAFAAVAQDGSLAFRRAAAIGLSHPSGLGAWRDLLAVASEDETRHASLRIYRDPVESVQVVHLDELVFDGSHGEPKGREKKSGAAWLAWTRLVCGRYLGLVGGHEFGRDHGWAVLYDPGAQGKARFSIPAAYTKSTYHGPRIGFVGAQLGDVNGASFIAGSDGTIYLLVVEIKGLQFLRGVFKLFRVEQGDARTPIVLRFLAEQPICAQGNTSFRWGSTAYVNGAGGLTTVCSEAGHGLNLSFSELAGPKR